MQHAKELNWRKKKDVGVAPVGRELINVIVVGVANESFVELYSTPSPRRTPFCIIVYPWAQ